MKVRFGGVAGVADQPEHLPELYMVAEFYLEASGLQMAVKGVSAMADIQDYMIAAYGFQSDGHGARIFSRNVFRNSIFDFSNRSVRHDQYITAVCPIILVVLFVPDKGIAVRVHTYPVNGKALGNLCATINRDQRASMLRSVSRPIAGQPAIAAQRRRDYGKVAVHCNMRTPDRDGIRILANFCRDL